MSALLEKVRNYLHLDESGPTNVRLAPLISAAEGYLTNAGVKVPTDDNQKDLYDLAVAINVAIDAYADERTAPLLQKSFDKIVLQLKYGGGDSVT